MKKYLWLVLIALMAGFIIGPHWYNVIQVNRNTAVTSHSEEANMHEIKSSQKLIISCTASNTVQTIAIPSDTLGGQIDHDISYTNLTNVSISINGNSINLEDAIRAGYISKEEIHAYAQLDAKNGFCAETYTSNNGLTKFTYKYPEYDLWVVNDVYETPDGLTHRISDMGLCQSGASVHTIYTDGTTEIPIDLENWGLDFKVIRTTATSLTLEITQYEGQQIGELQTDWYSIYPENSDISIPMLENVLPTSQWDCKYRIKSNSSTQISIDWTATHSKLPKGTYIMWLSITDIYNESDVHPLMKNYTDTISYPIEFTIS